MESNNNDYGKIIRNVGLFLGIPLVICLLMWLLFDNRTSAGDVKYSDFVGYFERGEVEHFELDLGSGVLARLTGRMPPEELTALLAAQRSPRRLDGWLLDTFGGFSPLVCRELAFCLTGDLDTDVSELPEAEKTALAARLHARIEQLRTQPPQPVLLEKDGRPWDFTCLPVTCSMCSRNAAIRSFPSK